MAQDMTEKELLKMELDQLKKEVKNERQMVGIAPECKTGSNLGTLRMLMGHTLQIHVDLEADDKQQSSSAVTACSHNPHGTFPSFLPCRFPRQAKS